jgi:hypothetical protein
MADTIVRLFDRPADALRAVGALTDDGVDRKDAEVFAENIRRGSALCVWAAIGLKSGV